MPEWMAARKPIEQRLTAARKQLAKITHAACSMATSATATRLRADWDALELSQQHAIVAAVDRHGGGRPRPARLQPLRRVALDARLPALSKKLRDLRQRLRVGQLERDALVHAGRSTHTTREPLYLRQPHCAQQAGGPRHPSTLEDSQTRSASSR